jgi:hypothetical protein
MSTLGCYRKGVYPLLLILSYEFRLYLDLYSFVNDIDLRHSWIFLVRLHTIVSVSYLI